MKTPVELDVESESGYVFVSGSWYIGELRLSFEELSDYTNPEKYTKLELVDPEKQKCKSCHQRPNDGCELYELEFPGTSPTTICEGCRDVFVNELVEFVNSHSCEISLQSL